MARPKRPRDTNQLAKAVVDLATGESQDAALEAMTGTKRQSLGGRKRADNLSSNERTEIARKAAQARWAKKQNNPT